MRSTSSAEDSSRLERDEDDNMQTYIALVPRGLEHFVEKMVHLQLSLWKVETSLVGEELPAAETPTFLADLRERLQNIQNIQKNKKRRRRQSIEGTCSKTVGTVQVAANKHVSVGYCGSGTTDIWTRAGQLQGTVWMKISTNAPAAAVANTRCLGPLLALIDVYDGIDLNEEQILQDAATRIQQAILADDSPSYVTRFQSAVGLWTRHAHECWPTVVDTNSSIGTAHGILSGTTPLKYRLSCMRNESKRYQYTRRELLTSAAGYVLPSQYSAWSVDLTKYDVEIVLLQRSHSLVIGLTLRPYQLLQTSRSFACGAMPPDVSPPYYNYLSGGGTALPPTGLVRLRPTTAQVLLYLAELQQGDSVLDPCAGIGTIPIEAHIRTRSVFGIGGDLVMTDQTLSSLAIEYARKARNSNLRNDGVAESTDSNTLSLPSCGRAADLVAWDATNLPIRAHAVDVVVSDLPFGQKCMSAWKLDLFLPLAIAEMARILRPVVGRMVLLCGSYVPILEALKDANDTAIEHGADGTVWQLPCTAVFPINVGGNLAWVVQVRRGRSEAAARLPRNLEQVKKQVRKKELISNHLKTSNARKVRRPQS